MAQGARQAPAVRGPDRLPILVIDDSLTTRMLEQSILISAGHDVHAATSAEEGLEMVRGNAYALVLVDVDMPGMDGFTFVETIRADDALRHLPAILVTSRDSAEDLQRGRDVGADAYIVKGDFAQGVFLDTVKRLIEGREQP
jgi:two-component system chemotaxis sensor kinase CheA